MGIFLQNMRHPYCKRTVFFNFLPVVQHFHIVRQIIYVRESVAKIAWFKIAGKLGKAAIAVKTCNTDRELLFGILYQREIYNITDSYLASLFVKQTHFHPLFALCHLVKGTLHKAHVVRAAFGTSVLGYVNVYVFSAYGRRIKRGDSGGIVDRIVIGSAAFIYSARVVRRSVSAD